MYNYKLNEIDRKVPLVIFMKVMKA